MLMAGLLCSSGCGRRSVENEVTVFAAASTIDALTEIFQACDSTEVGLRVNFASSSALAMLIRQGNHADLFLSASPEWAERVQERAPASQRVDLLGNSLVLVTPHDSILQIDSLASLAHESVRRIALADPFSVPAGIYARQHLVQANLWKGLESKVAAAADVRKTLALVEQGAADVGIVYRSDAINRSTVKRVLELPNGRFPIVYPLIRIPRDPPGQKVQQVYDLLTSDLARRVFERHGFQVLADSATNR